MPRVGKGEILMSLNKSWYNVPLASDSFWDGSVTQFWPMRCREGSLRGLSRELF